MDREDFELANAGHLHALGIDVKFERDAMEIACRDTQRFPNGHRRPAMVVFRALDIG